MTTQDERMVLSSSASYVFGETIIHMVNAITSAQDMNPAPEIGTA
jgi:hypothetical protein